MSCDNLVCAACSGPVELGRCATCRAARQHLHSHRTPLPAAPLLLLALALTALLVLLAH